MRRSICTCEPASAFAGEIRTWKFILTPASALQAGAVLIFDLGSNSRPIDWEIPSIEIKDGQNTIYGLIEGSTKKIEAEEHYGPDDIFPKYKFVLPTKIPGGKTFTIVIGDPKEKKWGPNPKGNQAQTNSQRRRPFYLFIDPSGKGKFDEPETFTLDIKGGELCHINVITPSYVSKNKRFDVVIRFEDEFGNLTSNTYDEETLIELTHEHLRENLSWKLFVPETGYINLPNLYFNEPGVYTITLENMQSNAKFYSPPMRCFPDLNDQLFWGTFHGESERVDSTENIESCLRHFRDEKAYNFYGVSPFENSDETPNETWKLVSQSVQEFDEEDRFTTFPGFQWEGEPKTEGIRQFIFLKEQKNILRKKDTKYNTLKKIYKSFSPKEMISIPCFTMGEKYHFDFKEFDPEFERVVEIYNAWGSSEIPEKDGNPYPIKPEKKKGISETAEGSVQDALKQNCRFGFVAGGLDDRGAYSEFYDNEQEQYHPGLTAILAKNQARDALIDALYKRSCYATTGERIIVGFFIANHPMGTELNTSEKQGFLVNRHIHGYAAGTAKLHTIEIIRNGEVIQTFYPEEYHFDFEWDDMSPFDDISIKPEENGFPFCFYYLRVTQDDGHIAWSSPIWIDKTPPIKKEPKKMTKGKTQKPLSEETL